MRITTVLSSIILLVLFTCSCKNEKSLQSYLVDTSGKEGFYTGDLPVSSILSANSDVSEDIRKTIKSVKKIKIYEKTPSRSSFEFVPPKRNPKV